MKTFTTKAVLICALLSSSISLFAQRKSDVNLTEEHNIVLQVVHPVGSCDSDPGVYALMEDGFYKVVDLAINESKEQHEAAIAKVLQLHLDNNYSEFDRTNVVTDACGLVQTIYLKPQRVEASYMAMD